MTTIQSLIEDDKGNVVGATTDAGDVKFESPVKRSDWEKAPQMEAAAKGTRLAPVPKVE